MRLKKKLGQYFLKDKAVLGRILEVLELKPEDTVLEIGAGTGVLTFPIAEKAAKVIAIEIDPLLCRFLKKDNIEVVQKDFLDVDLSVFPPDTKVVSNLPYYITTPILTSVAGKFDFIVFTMQEEVARRLCAVPCNKEYGAVSIFVQFHYDIAITDFVSRKSFFPIPKVDSCIVRFKRRKPPALTAPPDFLFKVVRRSFSARRKMLKNTLKVFGNLGKVSIDLSRRAETLSVPEFCKLADELWK